MYIQPNTNIRLLKNVPLDNTYEHTIFFKSVSEQITYFKSLKHEDFLQHSYQRHSKNVMRLNRNAEKLFDCNYLMFQNTSFGNKWFYGFITNIEYVSNEVCEIKYELDVLQTWFFDYQLKSCYVEREHSVTDEIGDNIVAEDIAIGEYIFSDYEQLTVDTTDLCVVVAIVDTGKESVDGNCYGGVYGGCQLWCYNSDDVDSIDDKLSEYLEATDSIVSVYTVPKILIGEVDEGGKKLSYGASGITTNVTKNKIKGNEKFGSYQPHNQKLYTYPYNCLNIHTPNGSSLCLRYEFFKNLTPKLRISGSITQPVKLVARPISYKGTPTYNELAPSPELMTESVVLDDYPTCSWNTDFYKAWLAQNSAPLIFGTLLNLGTIGAGAMMSTSTLQGEIKSNASMCSGVGGILGNIKSMYTSSISADICRGNTSNGNVNVSNGNQHFYCARTHITEEYAIIVDNFFSKYGYATKKNKIPNRDSRPHWNYVKTNDCVIVGSVPTDDVSKICSIYDNGITFWKKGSEVGDYSLNNSVALDDTPELH